MPKLNLMAPIVMGADDAEAQQGSVEIVNGYVDSSYGAPAIKMRPGLTLLHDMGRNARVDTYWWEAKRILIIVCARKIYAKTSVTAEPVDITPLTSTHAPDFGVKMMFAADEYGVTMTTGRYLIWWGGDITQRAARITDANAPISVSSIAYLKGYMIASIPNTQTFQWALYSRTDDRTQPPPWNPLSISASASPDDIICMAAGWEELFILGRESAQSHYASGDATIPFPALNGSVAETGTINANTLQKLGNAWIYFTPNYQVVRVEGRTPVVVSQAIDHKLRELQYFDEAEAFVLFERFYVLTFRRDDQTFVYDLNTGLWYQWGTWDDEVIKYREFKGLSATYAKSWGLQIVGGADGKVYSAHYDIGNDNNELIRFMVRSAHIDHGTTHRKFSNTLQMRLRVGDLIQRGTGVFTESVYGTDWTVEEALPTTPVQGNSVLYATNGYVYITAGAKIYRTTFDFDEYTEMTLSGTLTGSSFSNLIEISNGRIVTADNRYLWVLESGTTTFTKTAYVNAGTSGAFTRGHPVIGFGVDSPIVAFLGQTAIAGPHVTGYNLDTGAIVLAPTALTDESGFFPYKVLGTGIIADNGTMLIAAHSTVAQFLALWRADSTFEILALPWPEGAVLNSNRAASLTKDANTGYLYISRESYEGLPRGQIFWKSIDDGESWTTIEAAQILDNTEPLEIQHLGGNNHLVGGTQTTNAGAAVSAVVHRTADSYETFGAAELEPDGTMVVSLDRVSTYKIAMLTNGVTHNLYTLLGSVPIELMETVTGRKLLIRWRNDGRNEWSNYREVSLGEVGEYDITRRLKSLGCYRTRQYEIVCTSGGPVTIAGIEEDVNLGGAGGR